MSPLLIALMIPFTPGLSMCASLAVPGRFVGGCRFVTAIRFGNLAQIDAGSLSARNPERTNMPLRPLGHSLAGVVLALCISASPLFAEPAKEPELLFVSTAEGMVFDGETVTFSGVNPDIIWFTDRPERQSGRMTPEKFVEAWHKGADSFDSDPPNAVLTLEGQMARRLSWSCPIRGWTGQRSPMMSRFSMARCLKTPVRRPSCSTSASAAS